MDAPDAINTPMLVLRRGMLENSQRLQPNVRIASALDAGRRIGSTLTRLYCWNESLRRIVEGNVPKAYPARIIKTKRATALTVTR
jgi:hypothetical protein